MDGYKRLAAEIIKQAVVDYEKALIKLLHKKYCDKEFQLKHGRYATHPAWRMKVQCERFFLSKWFNELQDFINVSYKGEEVIDYIRKKVIDGE